MCAERPEVRRPATTLDEQQHVKGLRGGRHVGSTYELVSVHRAAVSRPAATLDDEQQLSKDWEGSICT